MFTVGQSRISSSVAMLGLALSLAAGAFCLAGCKGNTSAAAQAEHHNGVPPTIHAQRTSENLMNADPLLSPLWQQAHWQSLVAPANTSHTTPPTKAGILFDEQNLYVAVVCEAPQAIDEGRDFVSLYLDPTHTGRELMQVSVDLTGSTATSWIRSVVASEPNADGSPNLETPLDIRPNTRLNGLVTHVYQSSAGETSQWAVTMSLPIAALPPVMRRPLAGEWRFNIVRTLAASRGDRRQPLQSNISPVYVNAQAYSPYRLASLSFDVPAPLNSQP